MLALFRQFAARTLQLDFVHAHVEQLLHLGLFVVLLVGSLLEFDGILVVADKHVEVMRQNGRGLGQGVVRREPSVGPDFQDEPVIIGAVAADARELRRCNEPG